MSALPVVTIPADAAALPTVVVDKFLIITNPQKIWIAVGSQLMEGCKTQYHFAFQMSHGDARWLADMIEKQILEAETKGTKP